MDLLKNFPAQSVDPLNGQMGGKASGIELNQSPTTGELQLVLQYQIPKHKKY